MGIARRRSDDATSRQDSRKGAVSWYLPDSQGPGSSLRKQRVAKELRGDIQGLRAIAVLTVIAAHAGVPFLPGGYVGVDVFYVISGYLISGLLFREVLGSGTFSLTGFWSRRARRILPAATLVTTLTVVASLFWMSLIDARQVVTDAVWATLFAANVHFSRENVDYFSQAAGPSPLQHYWSLAVEEQFYVVWPLLLLACLGVTRLVTGMKKQQRLPRRAVLALLVVVTVSSFAWSIYQTSHDPGSAYFSTLTRTWELGIGALAALLSPRAARRLTPRVVTAISMLGLAAVVVSCVTFTPQTAFPGYAAALPVLGTALLLLAGAGSGEPVTSRLLSLPPMRVVGDWSYSLYLWHWPVLILTERLLARPLTGLERLLAVVVVFNLAALTYRHVEMPFRQGRPARALRIPRALVLYPVSVALVAVTCAGSWHWIEVRGGEHGDNPAITVVGAHPDDTVALVRASVAAARDRLAIPSDLTPDLLNLRDSVADVGECDYSQDMHRLCARGAPDGDRTVVVIGDSHARAWIPAFDKISIEGNWRAYYLVKSQCTAAHVTVAPVDDERPFTGCDDFHDWAMSQIESIHPDLVVVASSPPVNGVYDGETRHEATEQVAPLLSAGYDHLFLDLRSAAERVVLLRDVPKSSDDPGTCLTTGSPSLADCMFEPVERSRLLGDVAVQSARLARVKVVDPTPWLCYQDECPVVIGGTLSYRDTDHLTTEYAAKLAGALGNALDMVDA